MSRALPWLAAAIDLEGVVVEFGGLDLDRGGQADFVGFGEVGGVVGARQLTVVDGAEAQNGKQAGEGLFARGFTPQLADQVALQTGDLGNLFVGQFVQ